MVYACRRLSVALFFYFYSGLGDRQQQNGINYTLDLNTGLTQVLSDGTNTYLYGNGRIAQANSTTEYFIADALGSVRQLVDINSVVTLTQSYAPYGEVTQSVGNGATAYQFTGEMRDANGLVYLRARYYAPQDGRFLSRDTWGGDQNQPMSYNLWLYGYASPSNNTDPSGRETINGGILANYEDEHDANDNTNASRWTFREISIIDQALFKISFAYADAYNQEAKRRAFCIPDKWVEVFILKKLPEPIHPFTAFLTIHGGKITVKKHNRADVTPGERGMFTIGLIFIKLDILKIS